MGEAKRTHLLVRTGCRMRGVGDGKDFPTPYLPPPTPNHVGSAALDPTYQLIFIKCRKTSMTDALRYNQAVTLLRVKSMSVSLELIPALWAIFGVSRHG